jgi:rhodanese-related sulfurtransferase
MVDIRAPEDYANGHMPGAINIPGVDPTKDKESVGKLCSACHTEIAAAQVKSLHFDSHGYDTIISQRL